MSVQHAESRREAGGRRLLLAFVVITAIMVAEIIGGLMSGSLALLSDAGHMGVDALALLIGYLAVRIGRRPPDAKRTFGYRRLEILAALLNSGFLVVIVGAILFGAVRRLVAPREVETGVMIAVAFLGLASNAVALGLLHPARHATHNIRAAFLHILSDTLSSGGVIVTGFLMRATGWTRLDPIMSLAIGLLILRQVKEVIVDAVNVLLESTPPQFDSEAIARSMLSVPGVLGVHHLHVTTHVTDEYVLTAHIVLDDQPLVNAAAIVRLVHDHLRTRYGIQHATIEVDARGCTCLENGQHCSSCDVP